MVLAGSWWGLLGHSDLPIKLLVYHCAPAAFRVFGCEKYSFSYIYNHIFIHCLYLLIFAGAAEVLVPVSSGHWVTWKVHPGQVNNPSQGNTRDTQDIEPYTLIPWGMQLQSSRDSGLLHLDVSLLQHTSQMIRSLAVLWRMWDNT